MEMSFVRPSIVIRVWTPASVHAGWSAAWLYRRIVFSLRVESECRAFPDRGRKSQVSHRSTVAFAGTWERPGSIGSLKRIARNSQQRAAGLHKLIEMRDHPVRSQFHYRDIGIAKVNRDDGHDGGAGRLDVGLRIPDHDRAFRCAAGSSDGHEERLRVRLADSERVPATDEGETVGNPELCDQELGQAFGLVGADRLPPARPRAGPEQRTGGFNLERRKAFSSE